jgi:3-carboxy-cis,cis-muconate cycloisomerase
MPVRLIDSLASTEPLAELFADNSILRAMLDFEVALARVEARLGVIPRAAAETIAAAAEPGRFDTAELSRKALRAGTPSIPFVKMLRQIVAATDETAAGFVHWGATSQDVSDTALIILLKRAQPLIEADLSRIDHALRIFSETHKNTVMLGRTILQAAPPITLGLKAAGWLAAIRRGREQLSRAFAEALVIQFGGAVGTLAAFGRQGMDVAREVAAELRLGFPDAPWHTHRDRLAGLVCASAIVTGSLGKMARDISLLMQNEVGEAVEPQSEDRGGSSTMPHKRNPTGCAITLAAANQMPGLVASYLSAMLQEHERAVGASQSEWPTVAAAMQATASAAASIAEISEGLTVDLDRVRKNLNATHGAIYAEKATILLAASLGHDKAHRLVEQAAKRAVMENRQLAEVLGENPDVLQCLGKTDLKRLSVAEDYLGSAEIFRQRLLQNRHPAPEKG